MVPAYRSEDHAAAEAANQEVRALCRKENMTLITPANWDQIERAPAEHIDAENSSHKEWCMQLYDMCLRTMYLIDPPGLWQRKNRETLTALGVLDQVQLAANLAENHATQPLLKVGDEEREREDTQQELLQFFETPSKYEETLNILNCVMNEIGVSIFFTKMIPTCFAVGPGGRGGVFMTQPPGYARYYHEGVAYWIQSKHLERDHIASIHRNAVAGYRMQEDHSSKDDSMDEDAYVDASRIAATVPDGGVTRNALNLGTQSRKTPIFPVSARPGPG